jgi:hypothetical protein
MLPRWRCARCRRHFDQAFCETEGIANPIERAATTVA